MTVSGIAICMMAFITVYPILNFAIIMRYFEYLPTEWFERKFGAITEQTKFKRNSTVCQMWNPIFLFRRYTYAAILVVLDNHPLY